MIKQIGLKLLNEGACIMFILEYYSSLLCSDYKMKICSNLYLSSQVLS